MKSRRTTPLATFLLGFIIGIGYMCAIHGDWPWWLIAAFVTLAAAALLNATAATYPRRKA